ncbi:MAG: hypothetical protein KZQ91_05035 [Candidatus Thiodiazotropha sp. (ex Lucinoma borealis)]|nr:hypothetical protein [Candidatus Thiodiazotropha sp. (ex Lucinoma borealis)]
MTEGLVDNDVLHKAAVYGLIRPLLNSIPLGIRCFYMLGAAKYIIRKKLQKRSPSRGAEAALEEFETEIARITELEPSDEEIKYAANLELLAQQINVALDVGESILCAVLTIRGYGYLLTGDKRAISAIQVLQQGNVPLHLNHKLVCLEQMFIWLVDEVGVEEVRAAVCPEIWIDKALSNCFSCLATNITVESCKEGLSSYISSLRKEAPSVLIAKP